MERETSEENQNHRIWGGGAGIRSCDCLDSFSPIFAPPTEKMLSVTMQKRHTWLLRH